jgi:hypothetical protein
MEKIIQIFASPETQTDDACLYVLTDKGRIFGNCFPFLKSHEWEEVSLPSQLNNEEEE